ncbi:MAG: hypothetical protein L3K16_08955 [Thermoplasmata archaeon]|nr:hypothetical protein [Thermoplasmata archaeon]
MPTIEGMFGHVSIDQTLHHIGAGEQETTEEFAGFDAPPRAASGAVISDPQRQTVVSKWRDSLT